MLQGEEIEFALSPKDSRDLTKSFAVDLLQQLTTEGVKHICGSHLVLPAKRAKEEYTYFFTNGSKVYADEIARSEGGKYRIFEIATPEVTRSLDVVRYDKAAEKTAAMAAQLLSANRGVSIECYKTSIAHDVSRGEYTTRGAHESYRVQKDFLEKINLLIPFLALRQLFCGAGGYYQHHPVVSPRQFFIYKPISEVTVPVPMVCLRSEPLSDNSKYFRLQVLNGEATRSQLSTFLRFAITSLVIQCIQQGFISTVPELENPVEAARIISEECEAQPTVRLQDGRLIKASDYLQEFYLKAIEKLADEIGLDEELNSARQMFEEVLRDLAANRLERLTRKIEWVIKLDLFEWNFESYFDFDKDIAFPKETANNTYCAVTDSLFDELENQLDIVRLVGNEEINDAIAAPPALSRGSARAEIIRHFKGDVDEVDWHYVMVKGERFKLSEDTEWDSKAISNTIKKIRRKIER